MKDLMNLIIWMMTFKMKLIYLHLKIKKQLTAMKKAFLMTTNPVLEQIYQKKFRVTPIYGIYPLSITKK